MLNKVKGSIIGGLSKTPQDMQLSFIQKMVSVNHNGDSDSTGAVTGNILGAYLGYDEIPNEYKENLELKDIILKVAQDLLESQKIFEYNKRHQREE